ncbi:hydroxyisourate hydrolase [uncultured Pluralibacter sp.]|uniref:hydroxyisourate hydrolase n=1 Tax=uncultured Pluralibacter sp. TaxID=1490864 RepID=UPI00260EBA03|nr:hydroxyisourate hydrolase [uncultured Pluralibacter sp.]
MSHISTHILDTSLGKPGAGIIVRLEQESADGWRLLGEHATSADGRVPSLYDAPLPAGRYRLSALIGEWFARGGRETLYPVAQIDVTLPRSGEHYHLPFLIAPWGWSTYRGS